MNRAKQKGTAWETAVVRYLNEHGFPFAERRAMAGRDDRGDVAGIPGVILECKATREITLAAFMDETAEERRNAGASLGVAVVKRRQRSTADAYVVMTLAEFAALMREDVA